MIVSMSPYDDGSLSPKQGRSSNAPKDGDDRRQFCTVAWGVWLMDVGLDFLEQQTVHFNPRIRPATVTASYQEPGRIAHGQPVGRGGRGLPMVLSAALHEEKEFPAGLVP